MIQDLSSLIDEYFTDPEVQEVAYYALKREYIQDLAELSAHANRTDVPSIPPEVLRDVMEGEDGLANNSFYTHNFAALRTAMAITTVRVQTKAYHLGLCMDESMPHSADIVRSLGVGYADVLTTVAFLALGMERAKEFDSKVRMAVAKGGDGSVNLMKVIGL